MPGAAQNLLVPASCSLAVQRWTTALLSAISSPLNPHSRRVGHMRDAAQPSQHLPLSKPQVILGFRYC